MITAAGALMVKFDGVVAVGGEVELVAVGRQQRRDGFAPVGFVVDDEDASGGHWRSAVTAARRIESSSCRRTGLVK